MISKNKEVKAFIEHVQKKANRLGVKIFLSKDKFLTLPGGAQCSGYFDSNEPTTLAVATGRGIKFWITILVHEFCHMEQWHKDKEMWAKSDTSYLIDDWLSGKNFSKKKINELIDTARNLEMDCEKRAVKTIKKWNLPIDTEEYIQKSNAYILFYNYLKKVRKWTTANNSPYRSKKIYTHMSKKFLKDYSELPIEVEKIFDKQLGLREDTNKKTKQNERTKRA